MLLVLQWPGSCMRCEEVDQMASCGAGTALPSSRGRLQHPVCSASHVTYIIAL